MNALKVYSNDTPGNTVYPSHTPQAFRPIPTAIKVPHARVADLLKKTRQNDIRSGEDFPYMPFEKCSLGEAVQHLRGSGTILVQSGRIDYDHVLGIFALKTFGLCAGRTGDMTSVQWWEVLRLLKANYAPRRIVKAATMEPDTTRSPAPANMPSAPPPSPIVQSGVGMYAYCPIKTDFDTIPQDWWREAYLEPTGMEKFMGCSLLGEEMVNVFWSDTDEAFIAQRA